MMRRSAAAPVGVLYPALRTGPIIPVGTQQMTVALFGLAIYLFCVHSFKLPIASAGIAIGLTGVLVQVKGAKLEAPVAWMLGFVAWAAVTASLSQFPTTVRESLLDYSKILLIFFVAINACRSLSHIGILAGMWVLFFGLYPARGTFFNFLAGINSFGRYGWNFSFENYNDLAAYTILALGLSAFLFIGRYPKWVRLGGIASSAALALMVIITQSRGAFIGLVVAFAFLLTRSRNRSRLIRFGLIAAVAISALAPGAVWERFSKMKYLLDTETIGEADSSAEQRWVLLQIATTIAKNNLAVGVGIGAYPEAHGEYAVDRPEWQIGRGNRDAHNMYVSVLAETGLPGLVLFLGMLAATLARAQRVETRLRVPHVAEAEQLRVLRFGLLAYLIAAIFGSFHRASFLYLYIAILWTASGLFDQMLAQSSSQSNLPPVGESGVSPQSQRGTWLRGVRRRTIR